MSVRSCKSRVRGGRLTKHAIEYHPHKLLRVLEVIKGHRYLLHNKAVVLEGRKRAAFEFGLCSESRVVVVPLPLLAA